MTPTQATQQLNYILGLDLGAESLGWAILESRNGDITRIERLGAHTFDAGVEGDIESGKDESRAAVRRQARLPRRQIWRRASRRRKVLRLLQRHGLLPSEPVQTPEEIHQLFARLDADLRRIHLRPDDDAGAHLLPYRLRARALDHRLEPFELGRVFYHLAQRRGFRSNRLAPARQDEEEGKVKAGISELEQEIQAAGARTLGEYFAGLNPRTRRVRRRWTSREMFEGEFSRIWEAQQPHHPGILTEEFRKSLHRALFFQRPLKSQKTLIGRCELMPRCRRAPLALPIVQRFRLLQKVNDLRIQQPDGSERELDDQERRMLIDALESRESMTFKEIRSKRFLKLPSNARFNLEAGEEKKIPGNRTCARLREVLGSRWEDFSDQDRERMVHELRSFQNAAALARRLMRAWGLDEPTARKLSEVRLEEGYARHCRKAIERLLPHMESGMAYATARKKEFPESLLPGKVEDRLPPVRTALPDLRNPAVCRALTELRKVVNAIIRRYGKPEYIRIELATDLKRPRQQRLEISKRQRERQKQREMAAREIGKELPGLDPRPADIEKWLLAEECRWECPYTGRAINAASLLGPTPQFDIEHIWPMSRSLDNSFLNKTLCYHEENRVRKGNLLPKEAYGADEQRWHEILERVRRFQGPFAREKLQRFQADQIPEDFTLRQLQDTRYACRLAADYLGRLYGGRVDAGGRTRIEVRPGALTAHIRNQLMLHAILEDGGTKTRADHRHHAVDALAVGLASQSMVQRLQRAAANAFSAGRRLFAPVPPPWPGFLEDARKAVEQIRVSHRPCRKVAGKLHAETFYSKPISGRGGDVHHVRKELTKLTSKEIENDQIVDPVIRRLVREKFDQLGGGKPDKVFADPANHPVLRTRDGREVPIHKVRVIANVNPSAIGSGARQRFITSAPGTNHHMVIVADVGPQGDDRSWTGHIVTRLEAMQRVQASRPVVQREWGEGKRFVCSLSPGDLFTLSSPSDTGTVYIVRAISQGRVEFTDNRDGRLQREIKKGKSWRSRSPNELRKLGFQKVVVTYLGEIIPAHD